MNFEWDEPKNEANQRRHSLTFDDAALVFFDPVRRSVIDDREDYGEERLTMYGHSGGRLLAVTYTMRGESVRIISARKVTKPERRKYENDED